MNLLPDMVDLSKTPGIYYVLTYWLSCLFYILPNPRRLHGWKLWAVLLGFLAAIGVFMVATDGIAVQWFFPCMFVTVSLMLLCIKTCCDIPWKKAGYFCARAFTLGEFAAALEWQLFYFGLTVLRFPLRMDVNLAFLIFSHGLVYGVMYLMERKYRPDYGKLPIGWKELQTAVVLCFTAFAVSNLSYAFKNTPFSSTFTAEIFIIRTLVALGGLIMLYAYHAQLQELSTRLEVDFLQTMLHMQYENYRISEETIALVDQKYHDLKHQIRILRAEVDNEKKMEYLDRMEQEIRQYEVQNKTGNRVLDTLLSAKSLQCQHQGISLTCVADGAELSFMHPMDLSALFGNALDNAIEGVCKLEEPEKRLIHVSIARQKQFLRIRVENCYAGELAYENGIPATTKKDKRYHGFGLKSIRDVVSKYNGSMTISAQGGWFELRILLPVPQTDAQRGE